MINMQDEQGEFQSSKAMETMTSGIEPSVAQLQLDMSDVINFIEHDLKGEYFYIGMDDNGQQMREWRKSGVRMMNDKGVQTIISILHTYLNPNTFLTNLDDEDIERMMSRIHKHLAGLFIDKQEDWEIPNALLDTLMDKVTNIVWLAMKRAEFSKTLDSFTKSYKYTEVRDSKPKKRFWFF